MNERMLSSAWSLPRTMHFSVECLARGWSVTEPLHVRGLWVACGLGMRGEEEGQAFSVSKNTESALASMFKRVGWLDRSCWDGGSLRTFLTNDRRRGEKTYNALLLECGRQIRVARGC